MPSVQLVRAELISIDWNIFLRTARSVSQGDEDCQASHPSLQYSSAYSGLADVTTAATNNFNYNLERETGETGEGPRDDKYWERRR